MSKKKHRFILDHNLSPTLKDYLPSESLTTVECGLAPNAPDSIVVDLCRREEAILVTGDVGFYDHFREYQKSHNDCGWGLVLLPGEEQKQIDVLQRLKAGKLRLKHPRNSIFRFEDVRHDNLVVNLRANQPIIEELCDCEWIDD